MALSFYPKKKEYANLMDRLIKDSVSCVDSQIAKDFGRLKGIKQLREKDFLFIARDARKRKSIIYLTNNNVHKNGKRYFFDFF